ncbi:DUF1269 domain-containing protein [Bacillus massiliigorillae]|uniref:DUF1269 domain-containing protein n=1 Tax=Bacillus massiliigorillae TaxID=1243664 RepID=UPI000399F483|nr:DUF1269 domain-containing protein [Bacillus massiliigorillae]
MENVVISYFNIESEAFQALSELKKLSTFDDKILLSQVALIKKIDGQIILKDSFDTGKKTANDTWKGGLIGTLVGIIGGPIGMLLGLGVGTLVGAVIDMDDAKDEDSLIYSVTTRMQDGDVALVAVVQEETEASYDHVMMPFDVTTIRYDAAVIHEEVDHAREVENYLEEKTSAKMKEKRSEERHAKVTEYKTKLKNEFNELKQKVTSNK